jgi:hypothetical protein
LFVGPNFKLCSGFVSFFANVLFQLCVLGLLTIVGLYWVKLTIFEAAGYLVVLGLITFILGTFSLQMVHKEGNK